MTQILIVEIVYCLLDGFPLAYAWRLLIFLGSINVVYLPF